ncbi:hypothetical protein [Reichenbachiella sp.]|uniref:hypothetical protein n=1 Tax=Reichenbachiella sp. TaxID=2184521 RepID=UPI003BAF9752
MSRHKKNNHITSSSDDPSQPVILLVDPKRQWEATVLLDEMVKDGRFTFAEWLTLRIPQQEPTRSIPATVAADIKVTSIQVKVPHSEGEQILVITITKDAPAFRVVIDNPALQKPSDEQLELIARSMELNIPLGEEMIWPSWVDAQNTRIIGPGHVVTAEMLMTSILYFPKTSDSLIQLNAGGVTVYGSQNVPWRSQKLKVGVFELRREEVGNQPTFYLSQENAGDWRSDLLDWQDALIDATDEIKEGGLPTEDSSAAGLIAAPLPEKLTWRYVSEDIIFVADTFVFELELRGAAQGTARILVSEVEINQGGLEIVLNHGVATPQDQTINYSYESNHIQRWTGSLTLQTESSSIQRLLEAPLYEKHTDADILAWIYTPNGPLKINLGKREKLIQKSEDSKYVPQLFRGLLRMSEVAWTKTEDLIIVPDISSVDQGSVLVTNAQHVEARFQFEINQGKYHLLKVELQLAAPSVRVEKMLPLYLPKKSEYPFGDLPPELPLSNEAGAIDFFPLSFVHEPTDDRQGLPEWRMDLDYSSGGVFSLLKEGKWNDTLIELKITNVTQNQTLYWYQPLDFLLIPILPYNQKPNEVPERVNKNRVYMPLQPEGGRYLKFKPSHTQYTPLVKEAYLRVPDVETKDLFGWAPLQMPGIYLTWLEGSVVLKNGCLSGGQLKCIWSHELSLMSESYALQTPAEKGATDEEEAESASKAGPVWWEELSRSWRLSFTQEATMLEMSVEVSNDALVKIDKKLIKVRNLIGTQEFDGWVKMNVFDGAADLFLLDRQDENVPLITADKLLKGPTSYFKRVNEGTEEPRFEPCATISDWKLTAGVFTPTRLIKEETHYFDQFGFQFDELKHPMLPRRVIRDTDHGRQSYLLWSANTIDMQGEDFRCQCFFTCLPLIKVTSGQWLFDRAHDGNTDILLREYSWGPLDDCQIDGFYFQPLDLIRVVFDEDVENTICQPRLVEVSGVIHFRKTTLKKLAAEKQEVRLTFERSDTDWKIQDLTGQFWWPLYTFSPDLVDTRGEIRYEPYIEGELSYDQGLIFGSETAPCLVNFFLLGEKWQLPCVLNKRLQTRLEWSIHSASATSGLYATDGTIVQHRTENERISTIGFQFRANWGMESAKALIHLEFQLTFTLTQYVFKLTNAGILEHFNDFLVTTRNADHFENTIDQRHLSIALNAKSDTDFELLPGLHIAKNATIQTFAKLTFTTGNTGVIRSAEIESIHLSFESTLNQNDLHVVMDYHWSQNDSELELALTGEISRQNAFFWQKGKSIYTHHVRFTLFDAVINANALTVLSDTEAFFTLHPDHDGLEIPAVAKHQLKLEEEEVIRWTAPQTLRLVTPKAFFRRTEKLRQYFENLGDKDRMGVYTPELMSQLTARIESSSTILVEADESFWLGMPSIKSEERREETLWEDKYKTIKGLSSYRKDYQTIDEWIRIEIPFIDDLKGDLIDLKASNEAFKESLRQTWVNKPKEKDYESGLIKSAQLENNSFQHAYKSLFENKTMPVLVQDTAKNRLWQTFKPKFAFDPGWVTFDQHRLGFDTPSGEGDLRVPGQFMASHFNHEYSLKHYKLHRDDDGFDGESYFFGNSGRDMVSYDLLIEVTGTYEVEIETRSFFHKAKLGLQLDDHSIQILEIEKGKLWKEVNGVLTFSEAKHTLKLFLLDRYLGINQIKINTAMKTLYKATYRPKDHVSIGKHAELPKNKAYIRLNTGYHGYARFEFEVPHSGRYLIAFSAKGMRSYSNIYYSIDSQRGTVIKLHNTKKYVNYSVWVDLSEGKHVLSIKAYWYKFYLKHWSLSQFGEPTTVTPNLAVPPLQYLADKWTGRLLAWHERLPRLAEETSAAGLYFQHSPFSDLKMVNKPFSSGHREEIDIFLEILQSQVTNEWNQGSNGWVSLATKSFGIGIKADEGWFQILFAKGDQTSSPIRRRVISWVSEQLVKAKHKNLLLRASTYSSNSNLSSPMYFLLGGTSTPEQTLMTGLVSTKNVIEPDIHLAYRSEKLDTLSLGMPDYRAGEVYYVEKDTIVAPESPATIISGWPISAFNISDEQVLQGGSTNINWQVEPDENIHLLLLIDENTETEQEVTIDAGRLTITPKRSGFFKLLVYDEQDSEIAFARLFVPVIRMTSGSAVGLSYHLNGASAGRLHHSRLPFDQQEDALHPWLEMNKEVSFTDQTRKDMASAQETGWLLPADRVLDWAGNKKDKLAPLLPTSESILFHGSRSGSKHRLVSAYLFENKVGKVHRGMQLGFHLRMPRPVTMPELYNPIPAIDESKGLRPQRVFKTCRVYNIKNTPPFIVQEIMWQDPLYNKQLIAVANRLDKGICSLIHDRKIYSGIDLFYPEVLLNLGAIPTSDWVIKVRFVVKRKIYGVYEQLGFREYLIKASGVFNHTGDEQKGIRKELVTKQIWRYVFEIGLNEPQALDDHFNFEFEHEDRIESEVVFSDIGTEEVLTLSAQINTKEEVWPTPSHAYAVIRKQLRKELLLKNVAAFGWMPKPVIIKRKDKFDIASWYATFDAKDGYIPDLDENDGEIESQYEIRTITPYGEQNMDAIIWE